MGRSGPLASLSVVVPEGEVEREQEVAEAVRCGLSAGALHRPPEAVVAEDVRVGHRDDDQDDAGNVSAQKRGVRGGLTGPVRSTVLDSLVGLAGGTAHQRRSCRAPDLTKGLP